MNPKAGGSSPPQVEVFAVSKNFNTFTRTYFRVSKMNDVARAQLTFQLLTLLPNYIYIYCVECVSEGASSPDYDM